jgi:hypothetical protein
MKRIMMILMMMGLAMTLLFGCSAEDEPEVVETVVEEVIEAPPEPEPEPEEEPEMQVIGTDEEGAYQVLLTNHTGYDISEFIIRTNFQEDFDGNMLASGEVLSDRETAILFYLPSESEQDEYIPFEINVEYLVQITLEDGREFIINSFPIDDVDEEINLLIYDDIAFVTFESVSLGEFVSTLVLEQGLAEANLWSEEVPVYSYTPAYTPVTPPVYVAAPPPPVQDVEICLPDDIIINEWDD